MVDNQLLRIVYGVWAVAALSRAGYQYLFRHPDTFMPTHISAFVGLLYVFIVLGMRVRSPAAWYWTLGLLVIELAGVVVVGAIDLIWRPFPYATVWSGFGAGYLFVPLVLPMIGIAWLLRPATRTAYGVGA